MRRARIMLNWLLVALTLLVAGPAVLAPPARAGGPIPAPVQQPPQPAAVYFSATGLNLPNAVLPAAASYQAARYSKHVVSTPDYPTWGHRLFIPAFYLRSSGSQEAQAGDVQHILGVKLSVANASYTLTYNGLTQWDMTPGASMPGVWTDPLNVTFPAASNVTIELADAPVVGSANAMLGSFTPDTHRGEMVKFASSSAPVTAIMAGGSPAALTSYTSVGIGLSASAMVSQGGDGRPVALAIGDSLSRGQGQNEAFADQRGNKGFVGQTLDSNAGGVRRIPYGLWACSGIAAGQVTNASGMALRFAMISALPNVPFTDIVNALGTNDNNASATTWASAIGVYNGILKTQYPLARLIGFGWPPRVSYGTNYGTTLADQTPVGNYGAGSVSLTVKNTLATRSLGTAIQNPDLYFDTEPYWSNTTPGGTGTIGKFRLDPLGNGTAFTTTLTAAVAVGDNVIYTAAAPSRGAVLVLSPASAGNSSTAEVVHVLDVQGAGTSGFKVTIIAVAWSTRSGVAHAAGDTVTATSGIDGTHMSTDLTTTEAAIMAPALHALMGN